MIKKRSAQVNRTGRSLALEDGKSKEMINGRGLILQTILKTSGLDGFENGESTKSKTLATFSCVY